MTTPSPTSRRLTLNLQAAERALEQLSDYEVSETSMAGVYRIARNGAAYTVDLVAGSCTCEHHRRVCSEAGAMCKHLARVRAHAGAVTDQELLEKRSAAAKRDREILW